MSKHSVRSRGHVAALLARFSELKRKASRSGPENPFRIVVIQEAGLDGFWLHRVLQSEGVESHVVDPSSIATSRRRRRAKTNGIDGEALLRALLAYKRGEPRVCAMVKARRRRRGRRSKRRLCRERKVLIAERVKHVPIASRGLLFSQGISGYEPLRRDRPTARRADDGRRHRPFAGASQDPDPARTRSARTAA